MQTKRRRRRSAADWSRIVQAWEASGESASRYASRHDLNAASLYCWRSKLRKRGGGSLREGKRSALGNGFAEVVVTSSATVQSQMEVVTPGGHRVRIRGGVDAGDLRTVLQVLRSC